MKPSIGDQIITKLKCMMSPQENFVFCQNYQTGIGIILRLVILRNIVSIQQWPFQLSPKETSITPSNLGQI